MPASPAVDHQAPAYENNADRWELVRHAYAGEDEIKRHGTRYLPMSSSAALHGASPTVNPVYAAYLTRAEFPDLVAPTVRALLGVAHRKGPETIDLPARMEYLRDTATTDGLTLAGFARRVTREVLLTGRYPVLVDADPDSALPLPRFAGYQARDLINWRETRADGVARLSLAVLREDAEKDIPDPDPFAPEIESRYRALLLDDAGNVAVRLYRHGSAGWEVIGEERTITADRERGAPLGEIPLVVIGSTDLTPEPDLVPLLPLARKCVHLYQILADLRQTLFMSSQDTLVTEGDIVDSEGKPVRGALPTGAGWSLNFPQGGRAYYVGISGQGIGAQMDAVKEGYEEAHALGARLFAAPKRAAESGDALSLRRSAENVTLAQVVETCGAGIRRLLRHAATLMGEDPDAVVYEPWMGFADDLRAPSSLDFLFKARQSGDVSHALFLEEAKRMGALADDIDVEAEIERARSESIAAVLRAPLPSGAAPAQDTEDA